jgi:hypothetical protein
MPKFVFTCEHKDIWTNNQVCKNTHEFETETLNEVLQNFEMFLRGAGYVFDGVIDVVPSEDYFGDGHEGMGSTLEDYPELHSQHYFDAERNKPIQSLDEWTRTIRGEGQ